MLGDDSHLDPPDSISNSEVKRMCADDSVGFPHVKVGYRQALYLKGSYLAAFFLLKQYSKCHRCLFFAILKVVTLTTLSIIHNSRNLFKKVRIGF